MVLVYTGSIHELSNILSLLTHPGTLAMLNVTDFPYTALPRGDDITSGDIHPSSRFLFGTSTYNSIYVRV